MALIASLADRDVNNPLLINIHIFLYYYTRPIISLLLPYLFH